MNCQQQTTALVPAVSPEPGEGDMENLTVNVTTEIITFVRVISGLQFLLCIIGLMLYGLVCWIILKHRKTAFANSFYTLALALAVPDCLHLCMEIICALPAAFVGFENVNHVFMAVCGFLADGAYWTLAPLTLVISVNRYVAVCRFPLYKDLFSPRRVTVMIMCCAASGLLVPALMYSCTCEYLFKGHLWMFYCDGSCAVFALRTNMVLACLLTLAVAIVYTVILTQYKNSQRQLQSTFGIVSSENDRSSKREAALMFQFALISLVLITYIGTFWLMSLFANNIYGETLCNFMENLNSCVSPILYLTFGSEFQKRLPCRIRNRHRIINLSIVRPTTHGGNEDNPPAPPIPFTVF